MKTENILLILGAFLLFRKKQGSAVGFATENEFLNFAKRKHVKEFAKSYIYQEQRLRRMYEKLPDLRELTDRKKLIAFEKLVDQEESKLDRMVSAEANYYKIEPYYFIEAVNYWSERMK